MASFSASCPNHGACGLWRCKCRAEEPRDRARKAGTSARIVRKNLLLRSPSADAGSDRWTFVRYQSRACRLGDFLDPTNAKVRCVAFRGDRDVVGFGTRGWTSSADFAVEAGDRWFVGLGSAHVRQSRQSLPPPVRSLHRVGDAIIVPTFRRNRRCGGPIERTDATRGKYRRDASPTPIRKVRSAATNIGIFQDRTFDGTPLLRLSPFQLHGQPFGRSARCDGRRHRDRSR